MGYLVLVVIIMELVAEEEATMVVKKDCLFANQIQVVPVVRPSFQAMQVVMLLMHQELIPVNLIIIPVMSLLILK